ncbi:40S ribosomal protein S27-like [Bagarius yarrelli]|uniref:40S ribosomal protein S27 n=1 Tax=Bagarius yarrelli TaxID=175774 RepID=A0A556V922_BAGYA|nr:40S ribosomal protein S27-like [Bagarius yarrelli]
MEDFLGTWKLVKSVSYDEYLKAIGVVQDPDDDVVTETLSKEEDSVVWTKVSSKQTVKMRFTLDKEFKMFSQDGRYSLITISLKENQLVQVQKMDKMISTIIREVQGTNIIMLAKDLLHPSAEEERRRHKKKRLVQSPNSYFMDVKCPGCYKITTVFSHAQTVVLCVGCSTVLCQPTGGKARLTEGTAL